MGCGGRGVAGSDCEGLSLPESSEVDRVSPLLVESLHPHEGTGRLDEKGKKRKSRRKGCEEKEERKVESICIRAPLASMPRQDD